ncbi:hypothetical protein KKC1_19150 [Calderihabitans maritimus]|uniref:Uncharacterized protein n=1 Tax=Calderihabitans maritimus TaxID=1246530 RepID=A0A1Z5HTW7_9FIRM|nr:hypothetical protein KKC1_19150 [Calderihabitans maritimus]
MGMGADHVIKPLDAFLLEIVYNQASIIVVSAVNQDVLAG